MRILILALILANFCPTLNALIINCPNIQTEFYCEPTRDGGTGDVRFDFRPIQVYRWSSLSLFVKMPVPFELGSRSTPDLYLREPIRLSKDGRGHYTIVCIYQEEGKYQGEVANVPFTTLTLRSSEVKSCSMTKDGQSVDCALK